MSGSGCLNIKYKNMKQIFFTILTLSTVFFANAQNTKLRAGLSINPGATIGRYGTDFVAGGELSLYKTITPRLEASFSGGYTHFFSGHETEKGKLIPIKAGVRYALNSDFYLGVQAGVALSTTDGGAYFVYSPAVGWNINSHFDVAVKFDNFESEPSVLGINLTYKFGL